MKHSRFFLTLTGLFCMTHYMQAKPGNEQKLNILLITADDLNCSTTPMFGCEVPGLMPNIEKLCSEGMLFRNAHVVSGASQVSRGGIMTGLYPHNSGIDGFYHTEKDIPTVQETLADNGYRLGIIGKVGHSTPKADIRWDMAIDGKDAHFGRDPQLYFSVVKNFMKEAKKSGAPFFMMVNSHDPHRPFAGSDTEFGPRGNEKNYPEPQRIFNPDEIEVPGFLPDLPEIRTELAQYYSSVNRLDQTVGAVLKALKQSGMEKNTIVFFLSDNGMSMPFSKTNNYLHSTHTPLIVKWPGVVAPGNEDDCHFVNGIDFMPTIFEALGIDVPDGLDGRSFLPLLEGRDQEGRDYVYTEFTENAGRNREPMRGVQSRRYGYIFNVWSNGVRKFKSETMTGMTFPAMQRAAETDGSIRERVDYFLCRTPEEFYDYEKDPDALHNLIDDPEYQDEIDFYRNLLEEHLRKTGDPVLDPFIHRNDREYVENYMQNQINIVKERNAARRELRKHRKAAADVSSDGEGLQK